MVDEYNTLLKSYREKIDNLDDQIVDLLVQRENVIRDVSNVKYIKNVPAILQKRVDEVRNRNVARAKDNGSNGKYVEDIYIKIIQISCDLESQIFEKHIKEKKKL